MNTLYEHLSENTFTRTPRDVRKRNRELWILVGECDRKGVRQDVRKGVRICGHRRVRQRCYTYLHIY